MLSCLFRDLTSAVHVVLHPLAGIQSCLRGGEEEDEETACL
jgi:hypothetical protein